MTDGEYAQMVAAIDTLARHLAFFRRTQRYGKLHIGRDMELCSMNPYDPRDCSERCKGVAETLGWAAQILGVPVEDFYQTRRAAATHPRDTTRHITPTQTRMEGME